MQDELKTGDTDDDN